MVCFFVPGDDIITNEIFNSFFSMRNIPIIILILFFLVSCKTQQLKSLELGDKILELVLSEHNLGQEYSLKVNTKENVLEYSITYLGKINSKQYGDLHLLNKITFSGYSQDTKKAISTIQIYNDQKKLGFYFIGPIWDLPLRVQDTDLIFELNSHDCTEITVISFKDSIPKEFFVQCNKEYGDVYKFISQ